MNKNLPIKVILQREKDISKNQGGGGAKIFRTVDKSFISEITEKFANVVEYYDTIFNCQDSSPAVAKITLREDAVAKSHRPDDLCKDMDIIGAGSLKEIYVKVTKQRLLKTMSRINQPTLSEKLKANLSTVVEVEPIYPEDRISINVQSIIDMKKDSVKKLKIKVFKFNNEYDDEKIKNSILKRLDEIGYSDVKHIIYGNSLEYYTLNNVRVSDIRKISAINGIRSIDIFHEYTIPKKVISNKVEEIDIDEIGEESDLIIGIIDSGISERTVLSKDVIGRKEYVPRNFQNRNHGTFVASALQYGNSFDGLKEKTRKRFKFFDVVAIPNSDETYGPIDTLSQDDLYNIVEEVMEEKGKEIKVWNLSLGTNELVINDEVSDLAIFFDYIQDKYKVQFVIACGNYEDYPLRKWPVNGFYGEDRITVPSDSARAISVGSIALKDNNSTLVKKNEPSPFSRKGPGANYMVKPEVVDYGGNLSSSGNCIDVGVIGFDEIGNLIEGVGTSYSTPKVTYKYAKIMDELIDRDPLMAKGFLIHDARINSKYLDMESDDIKYFGFGHPSLDPQNILNCSENEITIVFKQKITKGTHLEMWNFPYPKSLIKNGKYTGEIFMTLVYNPPLDEKYGSQYCRVNFDASFGTFSNDENGEINYKGQVPLEKTWDEMYEKSRVEHGFKWSPIKSYYRKIKNGISLANGWKIRIDMQERGELEYNSHEFLLIITLRGQKNDQVYTDVVTELQAKGYVAVNLETRQQVRERN